MRQQFSRVITVVALVVSACAAQKKEPSRPGPSLMSTDEVVAREVAPERTHSNVQKSAMALAAPPAFQT